MEVALLVEHLGDTLRRGGGHRNHDKDHRQHHEAHENLHGVGNHAGQRADAEVRPVGADDEPRRKVADQDAADGNAEQHQRIVERQKLFRLQEVLAHIVGRGEEFLALDASRFETMTPDDFNRIFRHSAVKRAKYAGLKRNFEIWKKNRKSPIE